MCVRNIFYDMCALLFESGIDIEKFMTVVKTLCFVYETRGLSNRGFLMCKKRVYGILP